MDLNKEHLEILNHTLHRAAGQRYCGNSKEMQELVAAGFMKSIGKAPFCIDEYFTITPTGKIALNGEVIILLDRQKKAKRCPKCNGELPPD